ncbi:MAG: sensor histidine kinase [Saprospiraceae bacterium]|nr:sensor histidine kinase [Saprospiraceae bacterium]MCB9345256.1 sensor histidine kinase [Lewinellaceae bacterium]
MISKIKMMLILFLGCSPILMNSQSLIDSLENELKTAKGAHRAEALYMLSWEYRFSDKDKALLYGEEGLKLAKELKDSVSIGSAMNSIAEAYLNAGNFEEAEKITKEELPYARATPKKKNLLGALTRLGTINYRRGKFDDALVYQLEVMREVEKMDNPEFTGVASLNLGLTYMDLKRYDEAMQYYNISLEAFKKMNFAAGLGACYVNIAETLTNQKKYGEAEEAAFKGEEQLIKAGNKLHLAYIYTVLGKIYANTGQTQKRLMYNRKALALAHENQDDFMMAMNQEYLGSTLMEMGEMSSAKMYLDSALTIGKNIGEKSVVIETYGHLRDWHILQKQFDQARKYDELYSSAMDSVFNTKMAEKVADSETKYETEKKEAEISAQKLELLSQRVWIYGLFVGLLTVIILGYLFYNRYRLRKEAELNEAIIREQQLGLNAVIEAQEAERKRIAQELHDSIAQDMAAIRMGFSVLQHKMSKTAPAEAAQIDTLAQQLDQSCTEVRSISHTMMPPGLEQHGLVPSLELLVEKTLQHSGLNYSFDKAELPQQINEKTTLGLYRITQELLNNVIKHANATEVVIALQKLGDQLVLKVEDNGQGFDFEKARQKGNMGLLNIVSRVSTLGGTLRTDMAQPRGTVVTVAVPV